VSFGSALWQCCSAVSSAVFWFVLVRGVFRSAFFAVSFLHIGMRKDATFRPSSSEVTPRFWDFTPHSPPPRPRTHLAHDVGAEAGHGDVLPDAGEEAVGQPLLVVVQRERSLSRKPQVLGRCRHLTCETQGGGWMEVEDEGLGGGGKRGSNPPIPPWGRGVSRGAPGRV